MALKQKLEDQKPWAILRISRQRYEAGKPWKKAGLPRTKFEELLQLIPVELIGEMRDHAAAEVLVASIFGKEAAQD